MDGRIRVVDVEKYYGTKRNITRAVNRVSFTVEEGEFLGIMGASGSGKTTLLNMMSTIDRVTAGHIYYGETDITMLDEDALSDFRKEHLGFVFQDFNLLDTLTIEENIILAMSLRESGPPEFAADDGADEKAKASRNGRRRRARGPEKRGQSKHGSRKRGLSKKEIDARVEKILKALGIEEIRNKFPSEVSGGQKQRCACARALVNRPELILADEPTGALDSRSAQMLLSTFLQMNDEMRATILMVTHDAFSASYCQRILFLRDGEIFHELVRGERSRREFLNAILDVLALTGGDSSYAE